MDKYALLKRLDKLSGRNQQSSTKPKTTTPTIDTNQQQPTEQETKLSSVDTNQIDISSIVLKEYISQIEENIDSLLRKKENTQIETVNDDENVSYLATIEDTTQTKDDNNLVYDVTEKTTIRIPLSAKETIDKRVNLALASVAVIDKAQRETEKPLTNEDISGIWRNFYETNNNTPPIEVHWVQEYIAAHKDRLLQQEKDKGNDIVKDVLVNDFVAPALANYSLQKMFDKAQKEGALTDSKILNENDIGYCTKSLTIALYQLKAKYGKFDWLPDEAEEAAHPNTFMKHIKEEHIVSCSKTETETKDIVSFLKENDDYKAGCIIMMALDDSANPHYHAMLYTGKDKDGTPKFTAFNNDVKDFAFKKEKYGKIINIPAIIQSEFNNENALLLQRQSSRYVGNSSEETSVSNSQSSNKHFNVALWNERSVSLRK